MPDNMIFLGLYFTIGKCACIYLFLSIPVPLLMTSLKCTQTRCLLREFRVCFARQGASSIATRLNARKQLEHQKQRGTSIDHPSGFSRSHSIPCSAAGKLSVSLFDVVAM
jgi:hypothetical protein